jgi:hypothetical protein
MQLQTVLCFIDNMIFKIKHKLYIASGSAAPPPPHRAKNYECAPGDDHNK